VTLRLIDTHCHLNMDAFDADRPEVLARARAAGVSTLIVVGFDLASSRRAVQMAQSHDGIYAAVGVHPHDAATLSPAVVEELKALAAEPRVVAWGEIGLDYYRDLSPREVQRRAFRRQVEAAREAGLPLIIHSRDAAGDTWAVLSNLMESAGTAPERAPGVMHCFSYDHSWAERFMSLGFFVSFAGNVTFPSAQDLRAAAAAVPDDRLLCETDSPYLSPVPHRGRRNEPGYVEFVLRRLAEVRGSEPEVLAERVYQNATSVFGLDGHGTAKRPGDAL